MCKARHPRQSLLTFARWRYHCTYRPNTLISGFGPICCPLYRQSLEALLVLGGFYHPKFNDVISSCRRPLLNGPFIATQLNSTRRRVELSCVAINGP